MLNEDRAVLRSQFSLDLESVAVVDPLGRDSSKKVEVNDKNRVIHFFTPRNDLASNKITTAKYIWYLFPIQNLWEQFHSVANIYFLFIAVLQCVPEITITAAKPTILAPLTIVLAISAAKDFYEDHKRKVADKEENDRSATILDTEFRRSISKWSALRAGNIVEVRKGERFPADMVLLEVVNSTVEGSSRLCNVETMNLDGEANLKQKELGTPEDSSWKQLIGDYSFEFEQPSEDLYLFNGAFVKPDSEGTSLGFHVGINNLLLRGCSLQQTESIIGLVVYCGHDTRVMKNSKGTRFKQSAIDVQMNQIMILIFLVLFTMCVIGGFAYGVWEETLGESNWYLMIDNGKTTFLTRCVTKMGVWFLQMSNMVPISLLVTITGVKLAQGKFIEWDNSIKDELGRATEVHTSQVLESLGQVTHVFSDKTGTLTCNQMLYKGCTVTALKKIYGLEKVSGASGSTAPRNRNSQMSVDFNATGNLLDDILKANGRLKESLANFLLCHALCHNVLVDSSSAAREYLASSPDELALVSFASVLGLEFCGSTPSAMQLLVKEPRLYEALVVACGSSGEKVQTTSTEQRNLGIEIVNLCEFDNVRKRMSVVVRYPNKKLVLLMKGADTSILPLTSDEEAKHFMEVSLGAFAKEGLRTLCLAYCELNDKAHAKWQAKLQLVSSSVSDDRVDRMAHMFEMLETRKEIRAGDLNLLGATAIEDRLQDGVPDAIEKLRVAKISVWVLTGDKLETAIAIGKACKLLDETMTWFEVDRNDEQLRGTLTACAESQDDQKALMIVGAALAHVLTDDSLSKLFYRACCRCSSVLCCRVSPKQKADVVQLAQRLHSDEAGGEVPVTLAIGDGANDVAMITAAHVGVGLFGKEGAQAARTADFAIGRFRFIERLIFVHGRESYRRNSILVNYCFYKNILLVFPPFMYGPFMSFSGQPYYDQVLFQLYNVVFTNLPVVLFALSDRPVQNLTQLSDKDSLPIFYSAGRQKLYFNRWVFFCWTLTGTVQAAMITWIAFASFRDGSVSDGFASGYLWTIGAAIFFWVILGANVTIGMRFRAMFLLTFVCILVSIAVHPVIMVFVASFLEHGLMTSFLALYGPESRRFWIATLLYLAGHTVVGEAIFKLFGVDDPYRIAVHRDAAGQAEAKYCSLLQHPAREEEVEFARRSTPHQAFLKRRRSTYAFSTEDFREREVRKRVSGSARQRSKELPAVVAADTDNEQIMQSAPVV